MPLVLTLTAEAEATLDRLEKTDFRKLRRVRKALGLLETDVRHPSLQTHKYESLTAPGGRSVFEAYVENNTPGAYRIFFYYGPEKHQITVFAIAPHPD